MFNFPNPYSQTNIKERRNYDFIHYFSNAFYIDANLEEDLTFSFLSPRELQLYLHDPGIINIDLNLQLNSGYYLDLNLDEGSYSFPKISRLTNVLKNNLTMTTNPTQIHHISFKDRFITDYHLAISENKKTSVSDTSSRLISKQTYDEIKALCSAVYLTGFYSSNKGFEGIVENHSYISCSHDEKLNQYYLNSFFSYDDEVLKYLTNIELVKPPACVSWVTAVYQDGGLDIEKLPIEVPQTIYPSFYPWLNGHSVDDFITNYYESQESILLLYGSPGTGKSNLLKHLLHHFNESALITYQDDIRDLDKMFSYFLKSDDKFLIIEDADEFLTKRENGNTSMKRLLNIADGLTSNKDKKVIFTTNLTNLNTIDSALLRPGRCFAHIHFSNLDQEQANIVAADLEITEPLPIKSSYSLADLFSIKNNKLKLLQTAAGQAQRFGFKQP